ncbi:sigma-70 family RNA polymerase sigma factor [Mucilaginibacter terrae]|uniref:RNA polymerase sigma-70 factor (Family 1) n=1 Tax=Mucilaginibacter terrae TaxID=1955052 RepID=A0ABU3GZV3_9SPHI|nr:sigma-70 family RNA polymerase sigma factor [Mucilaginibacter terrae]MDT3405303.1 RNA polymerase sigma-70 factor (family 1) [Mucilaginibacter terrae]
MTEYNLYTDAELVHLLKEGDEIAFSAIYDKYWKVLMGLAYNHTKDRFSAEEIVQEVFLSLWKRKNELAINSLNAYLATAVKFSIFKQIRQVKLREALIQHHYSPGVCDRLEDQINAKFLQEYIDGIVEELPDKCKQVYIYSRRDGLKNSEISLKMNIGEKAVEAHITKALKLIRLNLKEIGVLMCVAVEKIIF